MANEELNQQEISMDDTAKGVVSEIFDVLAAQGVKDVVISPGSRNAPLIMAARARRGLTKHMAIDERSAAFMALGMAQVAQTPIALVCTSGTALLNYAPAIAEAYYQGLPLIVISADRPTEWIDQDDSQTLRQFEALKNYVKGSYDISDKACYENGLWYANRVANDAMLNALSPKYGPVHINVRLSEPLNELRNMTNERPTRIISKVESAQLPDKNLVKTLAGRLLDKKILITVGFALPDARLNKSLLKMRSHPNVTIMAETISNTHLPQEDYAIDTVLCNLTPDQKKQLKPDVVISIGGALISRMLKEYLRQCADTGNISHWSIGHNHTTVDCFRALSLRMDSDPGYLLSALSAEMAHQRHLNPDLAQNGTGYNDTNANKQLTSKDYASYFNSLKSLALRRVFTFAGDAPWSDLVAFIDIFNNIPQETNLFLSNGTAVRYAQIVPYELPHASYCNRGVSGIEGSTSAAVGGSLRYNGETLLITGDMSLAHDLGGLLLADNQDSKLKIIVINNGGGGIFRFVGATATLPDREKYFCADPHVDIEQLGKTFGFSYAKADSLESLRNNLDTFFASPGRKILEIATPHQKSALLLKQFLKR